MSGQRGSRDSKMTEKQINDLVSRLQLLLPQLNQRNNSRLLAIARWTNVMVVGIVRILYGRYTGAATYEPLDRSQSASRILQETCNHIRRLQKEVEDLSERLTQLMDSVDISDIDRRTLENFLQQ